MLVKFKLSQDQLVRALARISDLTSNLVRSDMSVTVDASASTVTLIGARNAIKDVASFLCAVSNPGNMRALEVVEYVSTDTPIMVWWETPIDASEHCVDNARFMGDVIDFIGEKPKTRGWADWQCHAAYLALRKFPGPVESDRGTPEYNKVVSLAGEGAIRLRTKLYKVWLNGGHL